MKLDKDFDLDTFLKVLEDGMTEERVFNPNIVDGSITRKKVKHTITTTTYTLIEDDQLVDDLVDFCKSRYCWCCRDVREKDVRGLLKRKHHILNLSKYAEPGSEYIFVMDYPDIYNYRYEGDYCPDARPTIRRYSFSDVLDEFIDLHPDKCRWKETVETKVIEED